MRIAGERSVLSGAVALAVAACAGQAHAQPKSDWEIQQEEREWQEGEVQLPAYPRREDLLQFEVSAASDFRFYIDRTSLAVGKDGVVRYTLVARSPAGVDNVSREGIRCRTGVYRIYAFGRADGTWAPRTSEWRAVDARGAQRWHGALWREYFCPQRSPIRDAAEGIAALEGRR